MTGKQKPRGPLRPESWRWPCGWPGCGEDTRGHGGYCWPHFQRLTPEQQDEAKALMEAYRADLAAAVNSAAQGIRAAHHDRYAALFAKVAQSPVTEGRRALRLARGQKAPKPTGSAYAEGASP